MGVPLIVDCMFDYELNEMIFLIDLNERGQLHKSYGTTYKCIVCGTKIQKSAIKLDWTLINADFFDSIAICSKCAIIELNKTLYYINKSAPNGDLRDCIRDSLNALKEQSNKIRV